MEKQIFIYCSKCNMATRVTRGQWIKFATEDEAWAKRLAASRFGLEVKIQMCPTCERVRIAEAS